MSLVNFNGCEPVIPSTEEIIKKAWKKQKTDEEKKDDYHVAEDIDDVSEHEKNEAQEEIELNDWKEEVGLAKQLQDTDGDKGIILKKLDALLDRKFSAIYRKITILEKEHEKTKSLLTGGCQENDSYWNFDNWRPLKSYGAVAGMADRVYAMVFDAIDYNGGVLRDNRLNPKRKNKNW